MTSPRFGGPWTEQKLEILRAYLDAYTTALKNRPFTLIYVDGFAGAGSYRESGSDYEEFDEFRQGSARIALEIVDKPFDRLVFIEKDTGAADALMQMANEFPKRRIEIVQGDANTKVPQFCRNMADFDRAVVFLDPYATEVSWTTVETIAGTKKIDCWILFPPHGRLADDADRQGTGRGIGRGAGPCLRRARAVASELSRLSSDVSLGRRAETRARAEPTDCSVIQETSGERVLRGCAYQPNAKELEGLPVV